MSDENMKVTAEQAIYNEQVERIVGKYGDAAKISSEAFNFRSTKADSLPGGVNWPAVLDKSGEVSGYKRPKITLPLYRPTLSSIITILQNGGAEAELILDSVDDLVFKAAYSILAANPLMTAESFPLDQISLGFLASQPKETKSRGIDGELLSAFVEDYKAAMPEITGKEQARVNNAASLFEKKFASCRTNKDFLSVLADQLDMYIANAARASEFSDVTDWLQRRLSDLLAAASVTAQDAL